MLGREVLSPSVWATEDMLANEGGGDESDSDDYGLEASGTGDAWQQRVTKKHGGMKETC